MKKFIITEYEPLALSIRSGRLLVTENDNADRALSVYSCHDGSRIDYELCLKEDKVPSKLERSARVRIARPKIMLTDDVTDSKAEMDFETHPAVETKGDDTPPDNGELKTEINPDIEQFPLENIDIRHAVETSGGHMIVCYINRWKDETQQYRAGAIELSAEMKVLRLYKDTLALNLPSYLAIDKNNYTLVCDPLNKCIVLLNRKLKVAQVLLTERELIGQPFRLCRKEEKGLLYICYLDLSAIDVYRI